MVDDTDYDWLSQWKWRALVCKSGKVYAVRSAPASEGRGAILMHRVILGDPGKLHVDHIESEGLDNRRINLRVCNRGENMRSGRGRRHKDNPNPIPYKGVHRSSAAHISKPFQSKICVNRKEYFLGRFPTMEDAARAYDQVAVWVHGRFARLNFPKKGG